MRPAPGILEGRCKQGAGQVLDACGNLALDPS